MKNGFQTPTFQTVTASHVPNFTSSHTPLYHPLHITPFLNLTSPPLHLFRHTLSNPRSQHIFSIFPPLPPPALLIMLSRVISRLDNPTMYLIVCVLIPILWPLLFVTWPVTLFFIVSNRALRDPTELHTNKSLLREMTLFRRVNAPMRSTSR